MADTSIQSPGPQPENVHIERIPATPNSLQNGGRKTGRAFSSPNWRMKSSEEGGNRTSRFALGCSSASEASRAISEGRRLYVGNMPYDAKSEDIRAVFETANYKIDRIDIAIDPFTRRNPSYCFVDLTSKDEADRAMVELDGNEVLGRPLKIRLGLAKSPGDRSQQLADGSFRFDRKPAMTDHWQRNNRDNVPSSSSHQVDQSRRLYIGGLPREEDQEKLKDNIRAFFKGYNVEIASKLFTPHPAKRFEPGDHYYLFVDFDTAEDAETAMNTLNGQDGPWGGKIRVQRARVEGWKAQDRPKWPAGRANQVPMSDENPVSA